jgi:23S rRNA (cytosine1962-C5)-methyltransferase
MERGGEQLAIAYEDEDVVVVNKPPRVPSQAVEPGDDDDLPSRVKRLLAVRRGVAESEVYLGTHQRLDRDTSGLVLYTLRPEANAPIAKQFEERSIEKTYLVAVTGNAPASPRELVHVLAPARDGRMQVSDARDARGKEARTHVRTLRRDDSRSRALLEATIRTGRTHQIRVQLAHEQLPVAGDTEYGGAPALRVLLHAHRLVFRHPVTSERVEVTAPAPMELEDWLVHGQRAAYRDPALLQRALALAVEARYALRRAHAAGTTTTFRLVHEEADGFPGLAVEVFGDWLVLRVLDDVARADEDSVLDALHALGYRGIYVKRHPKQANELVDPGSEQIAPHTPARGSAAPEVLEVYEHGLPFEVRLHDGLRTGLFLDQRGNRQRVRELAAGKRVLNLFSYTGSFSIAALAGGAQVAVSVDTSRVALEWADRNAARIGASDRHRSLARDAFEALAMLEKRGERFELVIVDPPSYSTSKRGRFRVTKDYEALCAAALGVLSDGGSLLACLNHHGVSQAMLRRFVQGAAQARRLSLESLRDLPTPRDFPSAPGVSPPAKHVLASLQAR